MSNMHKGELQGVWLKIAIRAQGETFRSVAQKIGIRPDKYSHHVTDKSYLNAESLAQLARAFPSMNVRFVLTGEGSPSM